MGTVEGEPHASKSQLTHSFSQFGYPSGYQTWQLEIHKRFMGVSIGIHQLNHMYFPASHDRLTQDSQAEGSTSTVACSGAEPYNPYHYDIHIIIILYMIALSDML